MTPQERELIMKVAGRVQQAGPQTKDVEAEHLINQQIAARPDSTYLLTQAVIVQEYGLEQAQQRIESLEQELEQAKKQQPAAAPQSGGSFLGGLFGGGSAPAANASQPSASQTSASAAGKPGAGTPAAGRSSGRPGSTGSPGTQPQQAAMAQRGGGMGDFMRSAAAMAVGVAGGHLLFSGLQNMFGDDASETATADMADAGSADVASDPADDTATEDSGGWGADQGVSEEALAGDNGLWEEPAASEDTGGWADNQGGADDGGMEDDLGAGDAGFDDGGFDEDWG